jgi:CRISP-associated protein Cas1
MPNRDLQELSKFEDKISYLYFEKGNICEHEKSIAYFYKDYQKFIPIPVETLALLMLGPGTTITHEAIKRTAESRCLICWTGEGGVRFYSSGYAGTYSSYNMLKQIELYCDNEKRLDVIKRMYLKRFPDENLDDLTLEQLRGKEGSRVRSSYLALSKTYKIEWNGRNYDQGNWYSSDPVNMAISSGNSTLYGIVHAGILASGFSPSIGFVHTGKQLSFVYDIADLYKVDLVLPIAFEFAAKNIRNIDKGMRIKLRDIFKEKKILKKIIPDIKEVLFGNNDNGKNFPESEGRDVAVSY